MDLDVNVDWSNWDIGFGSLFASRSSFLDCSLKQHWCYHSKLMHFSIWDCWSSNWNHAKSIIWCVDVVLSIWINEGQTLSREKQIYWELLETESVYVCSSVFIKSGTFVLSIEIWRNRDHISSDFMRCLVTSFVIFMFFTSFLLCMSSTWTWVVV